MALPAAAVPDASLDIEERASVSGASERQQEHAEMTLYLHGGVSLELAASPEARAESSQRRTTRSDENLLDTPHGVRLAGGILREEALVVVVVAAQNEIDAGVVEYRPDRTHFRDSLPVRGREERLVEIGHRAKLTMIRQILAQPCQLLVLLSSRPADGELAVQHDHVPVADVIAVVPLAARAETVPEVAIARLPALRLVIVVSHRRSDDTHDQLLRVSPRWRETLSEILTGSFRVRVIPESEHDRFDIRRLVGPQNTVDEDRRCLVPCVVALCDVTGADHEFRSRQRDFLCRSVGRWGRPLQPEIADVASDTEQTRREQRRHPWPASRTRR